MSEERQTLHKSERLCRTRIISEIFETGNVFYTSLFKVVWNICSGEFESPAQIAISIPKKNVRLAVLRNLIRRRIRESYRKNKKVLYDVLNKENLHVAFMVIFRKNDVADFQSTEQSVTEMIKILCQSITQMKDKC
jgi:ribonuclease P protein component